MREHEATAPARGRALVSVPPEVREELGGADLLSTIHEEIIPRLMMAHTLQPLPELCADARLPPTPAEVIEFAKLSVREDLPLALAYIEKMCADGLSLEAVLLDLVGPAARALGDEWVADNSTFTEVTAGLCTLQQVVHTLGPSFAPPAQHRGYVVLAAVQPEQHTLGIFLLGEFLRREGWGVHVAPTMPEPELLSLIATQHVEVIGLSVGNTRLLEPLAVLIRKLKKVSLNRKIGLLLGGPLPLEEYAKEHGVSCCADPRDAVQWVEAHAISIMRGREGARVTGRGTRPTKR